MDTKIILEDLIFNLSDGSQVIVFDNTDHKPTKFNLYTASNDKLISDMHIYCTTKDRKGCIDNVRRILAKIGVCNDIVSIGYRFFVQCSSHRDKHIIVYDAGKNAIRLLWCDKAKLLPISFDDIDTIREQVIKTYNLLIG